MATRGIQKYEIVFRIAARVFCVAFLLLGSQSDAEATKLTLDTGGYTMVANSGGRVAVLGSIGVARLAFHYSVLPQLDLSLGYTVSTSKIFSGDLSYGIDLGVSWYFLSRGESLRSEEGGRSYVSGERFRPFVSLGFHQRQFQSLQAGFGGGGVGLGIDLMVRSAWSLRMGARSLFLLGPNGSSVFNVDYLFGASLQL